MFMTQRCKHNMYLGIIDLQTSRLTYTVYWICRQPDWNRGVSDLQTDRLIYGCIWSADSQINIRYIGYADSQIFLSSSGLRKLLINVQGAICTTLTCSCCGINMLCWTTWMTKNKVNFFSLYLTLTCQLTLVVEVRIMELYWYVNTALIWHLSFSCSL